MKAARSAERSGSADERTGSRTVAVRQHDWAWPVSSSVAEDSSLPFDLDRIAEVLARHGVRYVTIGVVSRECCTVSSST